LYRIGTFCEIKTLKKLGMNSVNWLGKMKLNTGAVLTHKGKKFHVGCKRACPFKNVQSVLFLLCLLTKVRGIPSLFPPYSSFPLRQAKHKGKRDSVSII
jgi:hypothetical protein